ncbi:MAG: DUF2330 domain-containing protein [Gammaproteobacteria bacterium]
MRRWLLMSVLVLLPAGITWAFCGFYVAKADTGLFNKASQVVIVRDGDRTVLTMSNDFQGEPKEFAVVIPVPTFIEREQIHVTERKNIEHLDHYSAPRLVEYFDQDPCRPVYPQAMAMVNGSARGMGISAAERAKALGVKIEASYSVGEYDILILSAEQSGGLVTWLKENGYKMPEGAEPVVDSYIKQNMRFFVAKVNLSEQARLGYSYLRPIQVAYESPKFMLPIRLGTVNAKGPQELFVYALTRQGRVETTNYRTVKLPSDMDVPMLVKEDFGPFYQALFEHQTDKQNKQAVFLEYAWDMSWCDPCAADPLSPNELRELGVFWLNADKPNTLPGSGSATVPMPGPRPGAVNVFLTRLHVRYDREHFPEDLQFQETGDRANFQGRYVLRHPFKGEASCDAGKKYFNEELPKRRESELDNLVELTGWDRAQLRERMRLPKSENTQRGLGKKEGWWNELWQQ